MPLPLWLPLKISWMRGKAWVLEENLWFRLSENTREVSTWNRFDQVAGEEFSLHLCDLRACGHEEGRINLGELELFICSSALFASNPNPNLVWEPWLSSQSTRVFGAFCLLFHHFSVELTCTCVDRTLSCWTSFESAILKFPEHFRSDLAHF